MIRSLVRTGNSSALILTRDMKEHLGVTDTVDVRMEEGRIVLTRPSSVEMGNGTSFEEAKARSHERYAKAYEELAK